MFVKFFSWRSVIAKSTQIDSNSCKSIAISEIDYLLDALPIARHSLYVSIFGTALPEKNFTKSPVGMARDKPNDDPFLPEPSRKIRSFFNSNFMKWVRRVVLLGALIAIIFFSTLGSQVNNSKQ